MARNSDNGAYAWTYRITDGKLDFLAKDETIDLVNAVTVNDDNGGTDAATVTISIAGTDDKP